MLKADFLGIRLLVAAASLIVIIAGLKASAVILVPLLFALFLAMLGTAPLRWLERKRVPTSIAVFFVALLLVTFFSSIAYFLVNSLNDFAASLPTYRDKFDNLFVQLSLTGAQFGFDTSIESLRASIPHENLFAVAGKFAGNVFGIVTSLMLVLILMCFMLVEAAIFRAKLSSTVGEAVQISRLEEVAIDVQRYLAIKTCTSALTGLLVYCMVSLLSIEFAPLWGIVAFLLNYIPVVGSFVASFPALLLALLSLDLTSTLSMAVGYVFINVGVSNFLEPVLMGRRLGLSPLVVFLSLVFWGFVWGPAGMLLSVPLTMVLKILLEHSHEFRWIAALMGADAPKEITKEAED